MASMDGTVALFVLTGVVFTGLGVLSLTGHLPRNGVAGVRIAGAMASDTAWRTTQRASAPWMIATGAAGFLLAVIFGVPWLVTGRVLANPQILSGGFAGFLLVMSVVMVLVSRRALRALNDQSGPGRAPWDR
jgi:hypothetical protein